MKLSGIILLMVLFLAEVSCSPVTSSCGKPADVVFAIDTSSSIYPPDFKNYVLTFIQNVVSIFNIGQDPNQVRVGALTFSTNYRLEFNLNSHSNKSDLLKSIARIATHGGDTFTDRALKYISDNMFKPERGGRPGVTHIIIVITDGDSTYNKRTLAEAAKAKMNGAAIFAIGVGNTDDEELAQIASVPAEQFKFKVTDFAALDSIKVELALKACEVTIPPPSTTTTVATTPTSTTSTTPSTTTTTTTTTPSTTTTTTTTTPSTTTTTTAPTTTSELVYACGGIPADVFFILDSSSSIWKVDFEKRVLGFVRDMVSNFHIAPDVTRVGVMTFSDTPRLVIGLDSYSNKDDLLTAISPQIVRYTLGGTNTADALRDAKKIGFHESLHREGVNKIAIVITDGQSWNEKKTRKQAAHLKESGVLVYAIGVGKGVKQEELEAIANDPKDEFVFSVDDFAALSELKNVLSVETCGSENQQLDQPVCGTGPLDITFAFDANTLSLTNKHHTLNQIQTLSERLSSVGGAVKLGVTSGSCPPSMDLPLSSTNIASLKLSSIKRGLVSRVGKIVKEWRYKTIGNLKSSAESGQTRYNKDPSFDISKKAVVLILNKDNISEFGHIAEEILLLGENGVNIFVVLDKAIPKHETDRWDTLLGHNRVLSGIDLQTDYSGYLMEFICAL